MRQALTLFCAIFAYLCVSVSASAQVTENPYVESAYESAYGDITIKGVAIVEIVQMKYLKKKQLEQL